MEMLENHQPPNLFDFKSIGIFFSLFPNQINFGVDPTSGPHIFEQ